MFAISPTDNNWFYYLKKNNFNSTVNFWTPTPWNIKGLNKGDKFFFMLKAPIRLIGGFGEFVEYKNLTAEQAWIEFGFRNGRDSKQNFIDSIQKYIDSNSKKFGKKTINANTYTIGCIILQNCQFWENEEFKQLDKDKIKFSSQIVKLKYFDDALNMLDPSSLIERFHPLKGQRENLFTQVNGRIGQERFKSAVLKAYNHRCCISGDPTPELLEASHIQSYLNINSNHIQNGILLRIDLHRLFDNGLLYIDEEYTIHISSVLKNDYYYSFCGKKINLPTNSKDYPSVEALKIKRNDFRTTTYP
ncbi:HNH endonuclease [Pedobacter nyackensis]|uniref:Putative restriction endonuclease n=1 Tax=Pedobacter nyackensis TaxID=475255 RepID=A0A1W2DCC2_9SPHI|nr:HNH endonuclease signature motif containing protein [Pedobacter nyackensis]SMC95081.1 putative restriction endonuclease [Pedobacter nyackensis]